MLSAHCHLDKNLDSPGNWIPGHTSGGYPDCAT